MGSGWTWLVSHQGEWMIMNTVNAGTPVAANLTPLLALDMWEHSFYLDYQDRIDV
jgi:superoxide dismutase, Fe-Mn family